MSRSARRPLHVGLMIVAIGIAANGSAPAGDLLDLADEAFARTPGVAAAKAAEARGRVGDVVESLVSATGIGGDAGADAGKPTATERIRRAALAAGTHRGSDGTLIDVSPDGVVRFTTPDERMATVFPNGRRFYRATRHSAVIDVDGVDDPRAFAPGKPPTVPPVPLPDKRLQTHRRENVDADEPGAERDDEAAEPDRRDQRGRDRQVESGRETRRRTTHSVRAEAEPQDTRRHATGEPGSHAPDPEDGRIDAAVGTPSGQSSAVHWGDLSAASNAAGEDSWIVVREEDRPAYRPSQSGEDAVVSASRIPGSGVEVFVRESGARQMRLPDGTVVTTYPGLEDVNVTDSSGQSTWIVPRDDGLVTSNAGGVNLAIDPDSGRAFVVDGNAADAGGRVVIEANGAYAFADSDASFQARRPDNSLDSAGYVDAAAGAVVRYDADTGTTRLYTPEGVLGGVRNDVTGVFVNPATGTQLPVGGLLQPPAATGNPAAVSVWSTGQSEPPGQAPQRFPSTAELAAQYIAAARDTIARNAEQARLQGVSQEEIDRVRRELATMETETLVERDLERLRRIAAARAEGVAGSGDDPALAAIDAQIAAAEAALQSARDDARRTRDELAAQRDEAASKAREARETVDEGERRLQILVATEDPALEKAELAALAPRVRDALAAAERAAQSMIDYRLFNRCPNGNAWDECDHAVEKQQWLSEQLAAARRRAMGPALEAQARRVEELERKIAEKEKKIDTEKKLQQVVKDQAEATIRAQKAKEQQAAERLKAAETASDRDIREKDEALFNLKQKRIEVALRPRTPKSDLRQFAEEMGIRFDE